MAALHGVGILVTRPEQQAMPLCRLLEAEGAHTLRLAVLDIKPVAARRGAAPPLEQFDMIIFTSANAVRFGAALLEQRRDLELAAIGAATARALNQAGYRVSVSPEASFDSEGLLRHAALQRPQGRSVLIVKGVGGRETLERELGERGAAVTALAVYERVPAHPSAATLAAVSHALESGSLHVVTATSLDTAAALLALIGPSMRAPLERLSWLVPGARVAAGIRALQVSAPLIEARSADDQSLLAALIDWRAAESGA
ncbi:MAG TPA: uroporphyrinogen-III synthase [Steroidobacteraceae bacterium]|jgi:uroporphyrinogen-III synthase|nr:uroporphyrinogen-III synthase [Steroidobacteraceae bacterium]